MRKFKLKCLNLKLKKKRASAMIMVLMLSSAIIIIVAATMSTLTKTMQLNDQYNKNDDMKLAAESATNIAKSQLVKLLEEKNGDVIYLSELPSKYDFSDKINKIIGDEDGVTYTAVATLDEVSGIYTIESTATDD